MDTGRACHATHRDLRGARMLVQWRRSLGTICVPGVTISGRRGASGEPARRGRARSFGRP
jgi:hypothetical protein